MTTPVPKLARGWLIAISLPTFGLLLWGGWARLSPIGAALVAVFVLLLSSGLVRGLSTTLSPDGLTQLTLRGRVRVRWADVQRVNLGPRDAITLTTLDGISVRISPIFYSDFEATIEWLAANLRHVWPKDREQNFAPPNERSS